MVQCKATLAEDENERQPLTNQQPVTMVQCMKKKQQIVIQ
jgi:hypothetical protein